MGENRGIVGFLKSIVESFKSKAPVHLPLDIDDDVPSFAIRKLTEILDLSFKGSVTLIDYTGDTLSLNISNVEDPARLIGKDGMTLDALQTLLKAFVFKKFGLTLKVLIDTGDYKNRREDQLRTQAFKAVKTVIEKNTRINLRPMNAAERRFIHTLFENDRRIRTFSVGDGAYRHIVIEKKTR
jgi:spoIIIJ-associated protein